MSEEAGAWEIVTQMMNAIPRLLIIALIIILVIMPVSCYINRDIETKNLEKFTAMNRAIYCVNEYSLSETNLKNCFDQEKYGLKISKDKQEIFLNEPIYKNYNPTQYVRDEQTIEKNGEKIKIELVFIPNE